MKRYPKKTGFILGKVVSILTLAVFLVGDFLVTYDTLHLLVTDPKSLYIGWTRFLPIILVNSVVYSLMSGMVDKKRKRKRKVTNDGTRAED